MRKFLLALGILALLCSPAMAGKNSNGALVVHTNDALNYTSVGLCARFETVDNPGSCENANTQTNKDDATPALIWCLAAFAPSANPGVTVIYFGLNHNLPPGQGYFNNFGLCGPAASIEIPDTGWPDVGGNSVAFGSGGVIGDRFFPYYYLNAFGFAGAFVGTGINPTGGYAAFVDDSNPPVQDNIDMFGIVRWGTLGANECPQDVPVEGACCFPDGSCIVTPPSQCSGAYQGDGTVCAPINPCEQPEACCFEDGHCEDIFATDCVARGGDPQGAGSVCTPGLCPLPPVPEACCFDDGHCEDILADDCTARGGDPQGAGSVCTPDLCPLPPETEACCFQDGHCDDLVADDCTAQGGTPQGVGSDCATTECPPVATETTTWGAIKANYR
jgi:hypothetical protein